MLQKVRCVLYMCVCVLLKMHTFIAKQYVHSLMWGWFRVLNQIGKLLQLMSLLQFPSSERICRQRCPYQWHRLIAKWKISSVSFKKSSPSYYVEQFTCCQNFVSIFWGLMMPSSLHYSLMHRSSLEQKDRSSSWQPIWFNVYIKWRKKAIVGVQQHQCVAAYNSSMCACMLCTGALVRGKWRPVSVISSKKVSKKFK